MTDGIDCELSEAQEWGKAPVPCQHSDCGQRVAAARARRAESALYGCSEAGKHEEEDTVVVAGDAERHMAAHRRTSSRSLEDCNIHRSSSGVPQGEDNGVMRSGDNKKDK